MTLYTAPYCPKCELAIQTMKEAGLTFDIDNNTENALRLGIKVVPCLVGDSGNKYGLKEIISICKGDDRFGQW